MIQPSSSQEKSKWIERWRMKFWTERIPVTSPEVKDKKVCIHNSHAITSIFCHLYYINYY